MLKKFLIFVWEIFQIVIIALVIVLPIRHFVFQPFLVKGQSMVPNFRQNEYLIVEAVSFRLREPKRGEVIVFKYPLNPQYRYIKRIIGLPGEEIKVENGQILINGKILNESEYLAEGVETSGFFSGTLGENEYFVLGDNRQGSADSRKWGPLHKKYIIGRVILRLWPPQALAQIETPLYSEQ